MKERYNNNLLLIQKKKDLLNSLNMEINKLALDNYLLTDKDMELFYENEISSKKMK